MIGKVRSPRVRVRRRSSRSDRRDALDPGSPSIAVVRESRLGPEHEDLRSRPFTIVATPEIRPRRPGRRPSSGTCIRADGQRPVGDHPVVVGDDVPPVWRRSRTGASPIEFGSQSCTTPHLDRPPLDGGALVGMTMWAAMPPRRRPREGRRVSRTGRRRGRPRRRRGGGRQRPRREPRRRPSGGFASAPRGCPGVDGEFDARTSIGEGGLDVGDLGPGMHAIMAWTSTSSRRRRPDRGTGRASTSIRTRVVHPPDATTFSGSRRRRRGGVPDRRCRRLPVEVRPRARAPFADTMPRSAAGPAVEIQVVRSRRPRRPAFVVRRDLGRPGRSAERGKARTRDLEAVEGVPPRRSKSFWSRDTPRSGPDRREAASCRRRRRSSPSIRRTRRHQSREPCGVIRMGLRTPSVSSMKMPLGSMAICESSPTIASL